MPKETILVVDDKANIIALARMYLGKEGYQVDKSRVRGKSGAKEIVAESIVGVGSKFTVRLPAGSQLG